MANRSTDPLFGEVPERLMLSNAPLVRVIGQVRFSKIVKISEEPYIADFQEAIRGDYPHFQGDKIQAVELNLTDGTMQHRTVNSVVWRFFDAERVIRVSLGSDAITLETAKYTSRNDFLGRLKTLLLALQETIKPSLAQRVGFRYVDRLQGDALMQELPELIQPELLNVLQPTLMQHIDYSMTEIQSRTKEGNLIARYGMAPPEFSHDPDMAPPVSDKSWVLDIDSFSTSCAGNKFSADTLHDELDKVAARAYAFFRWSVADEFINRFGGS